MMSWAWPPTSLATLSLACFIIALALSPADKDQWKMSVLGWDRPGLGPELFLPAG